MELTSVIETRAGVRSGKPCFVGTRIAVYDVLDYLASGMTADEIVVDFPELTAESVRAAIEFAALPCLPGWSETPTGNRYLT